MSNVLRESFVEFISWKVDYLSLAFYALKKSLGGITGEDEKEVVLRLELFYPGKDNGTENATVTEGNGGRIPVYRMTVDRKM